MGVVDPRVQPTVDEFKESSKKHVLSCNRYEQVKVSGLEIHVSRIKIYGENIRSNKKKENIGINEMRKNINIGKKKKNVVANVKKKSLIESKMRHCQCLMTRNTL